MNTLPKLPKGWREYTATTGEKYYHNAETKTTQWEFPEAPVEFPTAPVDEPLVNPWADMKDSAPPGLSGLSWQYPRHLGSPPKRCSSSPPWSKAPEEQHIPCMLQEAVQNLFSSRNVTADGTYRGTYVDCTFGRGGHTRAILKKLAPESRLFAFDVDPDAVAVARELEKTDSRFLILHRPFGDIAKCFGPGQLDGVLMDLGVSSPQLDERRRGFNIYDGPLDMRMNQDHGMTASQLLQELTVEELAWIIHNYGEDDDAILSDRIAESIMIEQRQSGGSIASTKRLADIIKEAKRNYDEHHMNPAKLTFQAIRVFLNQEMQQLDRALPGIFETLSFDSNCCIIAFKRKESNAIRKFIREHEEPDGYLVQQVSYSRLCELFPLAKSGKEYTVRQNMAPIRASEQEVRQNWRARSSVVHVLHKARRTLPIQCAGDQTIRTLSERLREPQLLPAFTGAAVQDGWSMVFEEPASDVPCQSDPVACAFSEKPQEQQFLPTFTGSALTSDSSMASETPASDLPCIFAPLQGGQVHEKDEQVHEPQETWDDNLQYFVVDSEFSCQPKAKISSLAADAACVIEDFPDDAPLGDRVLDGYLVLKKGDLVFVVYKGEHSDEEGWYYGYLDDNIHGWFPSSKIVLCNGNTTCA